MTYWKEVNDQWIQDAREMLTPKTPYQRRQEAFQSVKREIDRRSARSRIDIPAEWNQYLTDSDREELRQYAKQWAMQSIRFQIPVVRFQSRWQ